MRTRLVLSMLLLGSLGLAAVAVFEFDRRNPQPVATADDGTPPPTIPSFP